MTSFVSQSNPYSITLPTLSPDPLSTWLMFGSQWNLTNPVENGAIDDIRIYDKPLLDSDVYLLYNKKNLNYLNLTNGYVNGRGFSYPVSYTNEYNNINGKMIANKGMSTINGNDVYYGEWIQLQFDKNAVIYGYQVTGNSNRITNYPSSWILLASIDSITWNVVDTQTNQSITQNKITNTYYCQIGIYSYIRLIITEINSNSLVSNNYNTEVVSLIALSPQTSFDSMYYTSDKIFNPVNINTIKY
jgi:hypothetical protein